MDKPKITPNDFFLWVGAMAALYASVFAFVALIFSYLDYVFPDTLSYYAYSNDPYSGGISYEMAAIIVLFPIFLALMGVIRRSIMQDATRGEVWVRRWALFLTLFIAGATVAGDLITLVMYFLNGDVTVRFLLKALTILLVAGAGFLHFLADLRGYWDREPGQVRLVAWAVGALAIVAIIAGFFIVGTPWQARLYRYDDQKVNDLQMLQSQIVNHWQSKEELPKALGDLRDPISGFVVPADPQTGEPYEYEVMDALSFKLCATFNAGTQRYSSGARRSIPIAVTPMGAKGADLNALPWTHEAGKQCFDRTIDPERYPPYSNMKAPMM